MTLKIDAHTSSIDQIRLVNELSGENVKGCMQCATCSGMCPMAHEMDYTPRKVMHIAQLGLSDKLLGINSYWKCASCHACSVQCPRGIDIAKVMEALRQRYLRKQGNHIEPSQVAVEKVKKMPQMALVAGFRKLTS